MRTVTFVRRSALVLGVSLAALSPKLMAQGPDDTHWLAWLGCWERTEGPVSAETRALCVVPSDSGGVDMMGIAAGRVIYVERVAAGERVLNETGCTGTETATWSGDGRRVFRSASLACQGDTNHGLSQLYAFLPDGSWLDVQGIGSEQGTAIRVLRFTELASLDGIPAAVAARLASVAGVAAARSSARQPLTVDAVAEATRHLTSQVVQVWLAEQQQAFALNGGQLRALAAAGVPGDVIDVMVAVSFPRVFQLEHYMEISDTRAGAKSAGLATPTVVYGMQLTDPECNPEMFGLGTYNRVAAQFCVDPRGLSYYPAGFSAGPFRSQGSWFWGFRPGVGTWYRGFQPIGILSEGRTVGSSAYQPPPHGRVINGQGYQEGAGGIENTRQQGRPRDNGSSTGSSTNTEQAASPSSGSSGSAPASQAPQRTAQPRP